MLTKLERKILEELAYRTRGDIKQAAQNLDIERDKIWKALYRVRQRRLRARRFINQLLNYEQQNRRLKKLLIPTQDYEEEDDFA